MEAGAGPGIKPGKTPAEPVHAQLAAPQKIRLLSDPVALSQLHFEVWTSPEAHALWRDAIASPGIVGEIIELPPLAIAQEPVRSAAGA